jgi:hypothetical protein
LSHYRARDLDEGAVEEARRDLQKTARLSRLVGFTVLLVVVCAAAGAAMLFNEFARYTFLTTPYREAVNHFVADCGHLQDCKDLTFFGPTIVLFERVSQDNPAVPEPYIYQAAMRLLAYTHEPPYKADPILLANAHVFCDKALRYRADYPMAYYYLAAVGFLSKDRAECLTQLDHCRLAAKQRLENGSDFQKQLLKKVDALQQHVTKQGVKGNIDLLPVEKMMPPPRKLLGQGGCRSLIAAVP